MTNLATRITPICKFIEEYVAKSDCSCQDIAVMAGYSSEKIIYMLIRGETRLPLDRVPALASALECDRAQLMVLALQQFFAPEMMEEIQECFTSPAENSNEREWLKTIRDIHGGTVPPLKLHQRSKLEALLNLEG